MLAPGAGKTKKTYIWVYAAGGKGPPYRIFDFTLKRNHTYPEKILKNFKGYLHADAFGGYNALFKANFNTMANQYDNGVGKILDCLDKSSLSKNTLVIITTDHGIAFPRAKCTMLDSGIGVLMMMRGPKGFEGGKVIDSLVSHIDIFPTICDVAGIDKPSRLQGKSIMPLITGEVDEINEEIFAEVNFHAAYEPLRCVRTKRYKYIKRWLKRDKTVLSNCDPGHSKTLWLNNGLLDKNLFHEELYDLMFDPNEVNNLINNPDLEEILKDLRRSLQRWMYKTNDPALHGMPGKHCIATAMINDQNEIEPKLGAEITTEFGKRNELL